MPSENPKIKVDLLNALGVGFLILSLVAVAATISNPLKTQLLSLLAVPIEPPITGYKTPTPPIPTRTPSPSPSSTPKSVGAGGVFSPVQVTPLSPGPITPVTPCFGGCSAADITLPGQIPGRPGYVYQNGNIAGFYEYPKGSGKYYPVNPSAKGPTTADLNNLANTINARNAATYNPTAYNDLLKLNPTVAKTVTQTLMDQCKTDKPAGIDCTTTAGLTLFIVSEQNTASKLIQKVGSQSGGYTSLQRNIDLAQLQVYLNRGIITQDAYDLAAKAATAAKSAETGPTGNTGGRTVATKPTATPLSIGSIAQITGSGPTTHPSGSISPTPFNFVEFVSNLINQASGGVQETIHLGATPTPKIVDRSQIVNVTDSGTAPTPTPIDRSKIVQITDSGKAPTPTSSFVQRVNNAIAQALQSVGPGPTPTPRSATTPDVRKGISYNPATNTTTESTTTYQNTSDGLITSTIEVTKDTTTGRVTSTSSQQTKITKTTYEQNAGGIVRHDTIATTDLATGKVVDTKTTTTQITNTSPVTDNNQRPAATLSPFQNLINNIFGSIVSNVFNTNQNSTTTGTAGTTKVVTGFGAILNPPVSTTGQTETLPQGQSQQSQPANAPLSPEQAMIQFAQNKVANCFAAYGGNYNACIGSDYHGQVLNPGDSINPVFGGNPEGNPNSMYFCTTLIIDAAHQVGVNLPNSTGALQMYVNFQNENAVISATSVGANVLYVVKPGMVAFIDKPTGSSQQSYNVGHAGLVKSVSVGSDGSIKIVILQTNASTTEATYQLDKDGRLYTSVNGVPYYIRGFGDIAAYAENTNQTVTPPPKNSQNNTGGQSQSTISSPAVANSLVNNTILNFAEDKMATCIPGRGGLYNACVGEYYNGTVLTQDQAATLQPSPWEAQLNNGDPKKIYWCTELVLDAAKNAGIDLGPTSKVGPVHSMYDALKFKGLTVDASQVNSSNITQEVKPGMVVFINTPTVDPQGSTFDHAAIVKDVNVANTIDANGNAKIVTNVTIIQSNASTVEATYELTPDGKLTYKASDGTYTINSFADLTNYGK